LALVGWLTDCGAVQEEMQLIKEIRESLTPARVRDTLCRLVDTSTYTWAILKPQGRVEVMVRKALRISGLLAVGSVGFPPECFMTLLRS
jgi:hypothetical protein